MQRIFTTIAVSVALASPLSVANANEGCSKLSASPPVPNYPTHVRNVTWRNQQASCQPTNASGSQVQAKSFTFTVSVGNQPLSQLSLNVPTQVRLSEAISVTNQAGEKVPATVSLNGQKATLVFAQPIASGSTLTIVKQASAPKTIQSFESEVIGKTVNGASEISLGIVKVQPALKTAIN
jgi:hypothetical protein